MLVKAMVNVLFIMPFKLYVAAVIGPRVLLLARRKIINPGTDEPVRKASHRDAARFHSEMLRVRGSSKSPANFPDLIIKLSVPDSPCFDFLRQHLAVITEINK